MTRNVVPRVRAQLEDVLEQLQRQRRRHPGHRFVEQDHARARHQRPPELQQLALTSGKRAREVVGQAGQPDQLEHFVALARGLRVRVARTAPRCKQRRTEKLARLIRRREQHVLEHASCA